MNIFETIAKEHETSIIQREEVLLPDFSPNEFLHRDSETLEIAAILKKIADS